MQTAWNLTEAVTRFWDILISGFDTVVAKAGKTEDLPPYVRNMRNLRPKDMPPSLVIDEEFDYAMRIEDWYAKPYLFF